MSEYRFPDESDDTKQADWEEVSDNDAVSIEVSGEAEIEVVDDTPERDRGRKPLDREVSDPTDDEMQSYSDGVKKRIKELTHARHDERRKAEALAREKAELERVARAMMEENQRLKQYVQAGEQEYTKVALSAAEAELEQARRKLKEAHEAFDTDAIIAAQEALADAKVKVNETKNFKPTPVQTQEEVVQTPQIESRPQIDDKTLRWQAKNQWFGASGYEEISAYALGLHQKLVNSGVNPRSDAYFEQIDARLHAKFPEVFGEKEAPQTAAPKKPSTVVAPATRSTGVKKVQLTSTQIALAKKLGITPQQYYAELAKLEKQNG